MNNNIIWTCTFCNRIPSAQSSRKCPRCGRKLTPWDPSKDSLERQPEWPPTKCKVESSVDGDEDYIEYTKFYGKNDN